MESTTVCNHSPEQAKTSERDPQLMEMGEAPLKPMELFQFTPAENLAQDVEHRPLQFKMKSHHKMRDAATK